MTAETSDPLICLLTEDQVAIRDLARTVAEREFSSKAQEWDREDRALPEEARLGLARLDLIGITLPTELGGSGRPLLDGLVALEEIAKVCQLAAWPVFEACTGAARVIELCGTPEQRARFLPAVASGEHVIAVAMSEPDAGSAATDLSTTAVAHGGDLVLNGVKRWCSGAGYASRYLVYCRMAETPGARGFHGGYGYTEAYGLERLQRDAHGWALAGGTANMQRIRIASSYLGRRFDQRSD
jgi:alkylation response protein AidB-like acyl-CoA dehydrogenase